MRVGAPQYAPRMSTPDLLSRDYYTLIAAILAAETPTLEGALKAYDELDALKNGPEHQRMSRRYWRSFAKAADVAFVYWLREAATERAEEELGIRDAVHSIEVAVALFEHLSRLRDKTTGKVLFPILTPVDVQRMLKNHQAIFAEIEKLDLAFPREHLAERARVTEPPRE